MAVRELVALFILSVILVCCESGFVDSLPKCKAWDYECQKNVIQSVIHNMGKTGIQDLDIIQLDPLDITGLHVPVFDLIEFTIIEGNVRGINDCTLTQFITNFHLGQVSFEALCDLFVEAKHRAASYNPLLKIFMGTEALHGEGIGQMKIDKLKMSVDFPFGVESRDNNLYINSLGYGNFTFDVLDKVQFYADKCIETDQSSEILVRIFNSNWELVTDFVMRIIKDTSSGLINDISSKFFSNVPLKYFVAEG